VIARPGLADHEGVERAAERVECANRQACSLDVFSSHADVAVPARSIRKDLRPTGLGRR